MIDVRLYGAIPDGVTDCSSAINTALIDGDVIIQNGIFAIASSIKIPSNRTVWGRNAKVKTKNGTYDNTFRNSDFVNGNVNINIISLGNFVVDGNSANNNDNYATYGHEASVGAYHYLTIAMCGVNGFEISGLNISDFPHWMMLLQNCQNGSVHDIFINFKTLVINQDGIDIGCKSNNIEIYNIKGYTADDFFCINTLPISDLAINIPNFNVGDIHDIHYHDIVNYTSWLGSIMAIAGSGGNKIYNVLNENVFQKIGGSIFYSYGMYGVGGTKDEQYNIVMNNIVVNAIVTRTNVIEVNENCKDITITNLTNNTGLPLFKKKEGITAENFSVNGTIM